MLLGERRIDETLLRTLLGWRHSGFSLHNAVRIGAQDADSRRTVAEYILRSPFSQEKLHYQAKTGTLVYRSKRTRWSARTVAEPCGFSGSSSSPRSSRRSSPTSGCGPPTSTVRPRGYPLP